MMLIVAIWLSFIGGILFSAIYFRVNEDKIYYKLMLKKLKEAFEDMKNK